MTRTVRARLGLRLALVTAAWTAALCAAAPCDAKGVAPEDLLKGRVIISDRPLPMRWSSASAYASQLRGMTKDTVWYDKKTGKVKLHYAAFFAKPVNDVQVNLVLYDVTGGQHQQRVSTENFMQRGDRVLFNTIELDKEDLEGNRKYQLVIEERRRTIASATFTLRIEGPHYSGKVNFTDEETQDKKADR